MSERGKCYVYEILVDGIVRYIGKGSGRRVTDHRLIAEGVNRRRAAGEAVRTQKFYNQLAKALLAGSEIAHRIVEDGLSSDDALAREIVLIAAAPPSQLWNVLPGGQGADAEHFKRNWQDEAIRARMLEALRRPEAVEARKARVAQQWADPDARERNRARTKEQWADPEFRAARIAAVKAGRTDETRRKLSEAAKARWADPKWAASTRALIVKARGTPESRARASAAGKAMWEVPGARERYGPAIAAGQRASPKMKANWKSPESRERHRQGAIQGWIKRKAANSS